MRILITGANRGLGFEFASRYAKRGDTVYAATRSGSDVPPGTLPIRLDVADSASIDNAHEAVSRQTDALDLLINNAGIYTSRAGRNPEPLGELTSDDALLVFRTNSIGPILMAQRFLDLLQRGQNPKLISISSALGSMVWDKRGSPFSYGASKAALNHYMRTFAFDPASKGITTILVNPGWVRTDMGGPDAKLSPDESVPKMIALIDRLDNSSNGKWFDYTGDEHPW